MITLVQLAPTAKNRFYLGISSKLFITFWLVILTSVLLSSLVTVQLRHNPSQAQANPEQSALLSLYINKLANKKKVNFNEVQNSFFRKNKQHLIIKKVTNNKVTVLRNRGLSEVKSYLENNELDNPVTIDFIYTLVTSSLPLTINEQQVQLFVASKFQRKRIVSWVNQLPIPLRVVLLLIISFLCCGLLAKSFSTPLIAIQKVSKKIGEGKLDSRITKFDQRSDEFGALAISFNKMAEQLENNITTHQRLLADVSHELRSPLTRLQLAVALAERNIGNTLEQQKHLSRCEAEVERLEEMITDVLTLSRLEHNHTNYSTDYIEMSNLVRQVISNCQYFATSKNVTINLVGTINCVILADSKLLDSAISNVLNNAVKYSPYQQSVTVELSKIDEQIILIISDFGSGVPDNMIEKLFAPFFRVADGRERSSGGTGLGLAIAQQAITLHQGTITVQNINPTGLQVTITLPLLKAPLRN